MPRKLKAATLRDVQAVTRANLLLCEARDLFKQAGATKAAAKARRAIASGQGAYRHIQRRANISY